MANQNTVELLGCYGSDKTHALSAWTSTSRELDKVKKARIPALLKQLADAGHGTPFEKSALHFLVKTDIATHIHIIKHRIAVSVNAESARYKELKEDNIYIPLDWPKDWQKKLEKYTKEGLKLYHDCVESLTNKHQIPRKRAKESARFFRGYNTQIVADVQFNFRSFVAFQKLRNDSHSQVEIQKIAKEMLNLVKAKKTFKHSIAAFGLDDPKYN